MNRHKTSFLAVMLVLLYVSSITSANEQLETREKSRHEASSPLLMSLMKKEELDSARSGEPSSVNLESNSHHKSANGTLLDPNEKFGYREWCDEVLGCLNLTSDWHSIFRPVNVLPDERSFINTRFLIHTRKEPSPDTNKPKVIVAEDRKSLEESSFDPDKELKFIVHGFIDDGNMYWLMDMVEALLNHGDYNVFRVDWGGGSVPLYSNAAANTRVVGLEIGYLVNWLIKDYGVKASNVHLIGHSLGAHACGYAGEQIHGLGRISGLDPAGPYYTHTADFIRLDPSDALFVDNIHTDAQSILLLGYGTSQAMGHMDFFPNGGSDQPGCDAIDVTIDAMNGDDTHLARNLVACNHIRSIALYQDSMSDSCQFMAHKCDSYRAFTRGKCTSCEGNNCARMGIEADKFRSNSSEVNANYYLTTSSVQPYCMQQFRISILTGTDPDARNWVMGQLYIFLQDNLGNELSKIPIGEDHHKFYHNNSVEYFTITTKIQLGIIVQTTMKWYYHDKALDFSTYCNSLFCNRSLYLKSVGVQPLTYYTDDPEYDQVFCENHGYVFEVRDRQRAMIFNSPYCTPIPKPDELKRQKKLV